MREVKESKLLKNQWYLSIHWLIEDNDELFVVIFAEAFAVTFATVGANNVDKAIIVRFFRKYGHFHNSPLFFVVPEWLVDNTTIYLFCKYVPLTRILRWRWRGLMYSSHQNTTLPNTYTDCQLQQSREWHGCRESDEAPSETHTSQHRTRSRNLGENLCCKVSSNHGWRSITHRISSEASFIFFYEIMKPNKHISQKEYERRSTQSSIDRTRNGEIIKIVPSKKPFLLVLFSVSILSFISFLFIFLAYVTLKWVYRGIHRIRYSRLSIQENTSCLSQWYQGVFWSEQVSLSKE